MIDRRKFLASSALTLGSIPLLAKGPMAQTKDPDHYFLCLYLFGGADAKYLFDSRPLNFKKHNKVALYTEEEPYLWEGKNGEKAWAAPGTKPLLKYKEDISLINGIHMSSSFDGHFQNSNIAFSGNPFGGSGFVPFINQENLPLDYIDLGRINRFQLKNKEKSIELGKEATKRLVEKLNAHHDELPSKDFLRAVYARLQQGNGLFANGAKLLLQSEKESLNLANKLREINIGDDNVDFAGNLGQVIQFFDR